MSHQGVPQPAVYNKPAEQRDSPGHISHQMDEEVPLSYYKPVDDNDSQVPIAVLKAATPEPPGSWTEEGLLSPAQLIENTRPAGSTGDLQEITRPQTAPPATTGSTLMDQGGCEHTNLGTQETTFIVTGLDNDSSELGEVSGHLLAPSLATKSEKSEGGSTKSLDKYNGNDDEDSDDGGFKTHQFRSKSTESLGTPESLALKTAYEAERRQDMQNGNASSDEGEAPDGQPNKAKVGVLAGFSAATLTQERPMRKSFQKAVTSGATNSQSADDMGQEYIAMTKYVQPSGSQANTSTLDNRYQDYEEILERCPFCGSCCVSAFSCVCESEGSREGFGSRHRTKIIIGCIVLLGLILFVSLMPVSFVYVEYDQIALLKTKSTGKVDTSETYYSGCYVLGPDKKFRYYKATAHFVELRMSSLTTKSQLDINVSFSFQYFIRPNEAGLLYNKFELDYDQVFINIAQSEIKNIAVGYQLDDFRINRSNIEKVFHEGVKKRLSGDCCPACCPSRCDNNTICVTCNKTTSCNQAYHVDVPYFQMLKVAMPTVVADVFSRNSLLEVQTEHELVIRQYKLTVKETEKQLQSINNQVSEVAANATAQSNLITTKAQSEADQMLTIAESTALNGMCSTLNVSREDHKMSLFFIRTLANKDDLYKLPDHGLLSGWTQT